MAEALLVMSGDSSDSDDEFLINVALRTRNAKVYKPRVNNFEEWDDLQFFTRFRLTKPTVLQLLGIIEDRLETGTDRSLSPMNQLLLTLRFYALGTMLIAVGDFAGVHKFTAGVVLRRVSEAIASLAPDIIHFPRTPEEVRVNQVGFYAMNRFPRVLGAIDCTHVRIASPGGDDAEVYRNRKGWFSLNVQTISDHKMKIIDIVARWPGSAHDQNIFNNSSIKARMERGDFEDGSILGDSGYGLQPYLITPLRNPVLPEETLFNEAQIRTRSTVERQYGTWKRRFPVLSLGMRVEIEIVQDVIVACAVLQNMAINAKEEEPPQEPCIPHLELEMEPLGLGQPQRGNNAVQRQLVEYYRQLLINY